MNRGRIEMDIKNISLEKKIGQMIIAGFSATTIDEHFLHIVERYHIGNIILFARNIIDAKQLHSLNKAIQKKMIEANGISAFISIDQEGGVINRIFNGATLFPGNMAITASCVEKAAFNTGKYSGRELKALGINLNLAPVLDVNNNPNNPVIGVRSYSDKPEVVGNKGAEYIEGLQGEGVAAVGKHFPGHGDTDMDSHLALPLVPHDRERLKEVELLPFKKAIAQGIEGIMTAHVLFPAIETSGLPGTLSHKVISGLLRKELGFEGLVITDCMEMKAIKDNYGTVEAAVMAVKAGADLICISHSMEYQIGAAQAIKKAVEAGEISIQTIDRSVERILKAKRKYKGNVDENMDRSVGCWEHRSFARIISQSSITIVHNNLNLVPVKSKNILTISPEAKVLTGADDSIEKINFGMVAATSLGGESITIELNPTDEDISAIIKKINNYDVVVAATYNCHLYNGQQKLLEKLLQIKSEMIHVALRNPYDIIYSNKAGAALCSYEYTKPAVDCVINVLKGEEAARGKLPVRLGAKK
jgi:beta-N-acetylhexosaminidase